MSEPKPIIPTPHEKGRKSLPAAATVGSLSLALDFYKNREYARSWAEAKGAIAVRPFHPKAWILLSNIACALGATSLAHEAVQVANQLAPRWPESKSALNRKAKKSPAAAQPDADFTLPEKPSGRRLSVCMIVKNEEKFLAQCLGSVARVAHEIIIVDTGSTDRTVEIARDFGARIFSFKWCDDFSAARNVALEHATGDWILSLDADEQLTSATEAVLQQDLLDPQAICYRVPLVEKGRESLGRTHVPRLFRNGPGFHFQGRVHEQIFGSINGARAEFGLESKLARIELIHHGYDAEVVRDRKKVGRNFQLLELAIAESPKDPNLLITHAIELSRLGRTGESADQALRAFEIVAGVPAGRIMPEFREFLLSEAAQILTGAHRYEEVVRLLQSAFAKAGGLTATQHFLLGLSFLELKRFTDGAREFRACLEKRGQPTLIPVLAQILTARPHHCLGACLSHCQQPAEAERALLDGLEQEPESKAIRMTLAQVLHGQKRSLEALQCLCVAIEHSHGDPHFWALGAEIALSQPEFLEFAVDWTEQALKNTPETSLLIQHRGEALLLSGDFSNAATFWLKTDYQTNPRCGAALLLCSDSVLPEFACEELALSQALISWYRKLLAVNATAPIQQLHARLDSLATVVPTAVRMLEAAIHEAGRESVQSAA